MHKEVLAKETRNGLEVLEKTKLLQDFYLAGGTGLALQFGHRISVDLDFFTQKSFDPKKLASVLAKEGNFMLEEAANDTLHGIFEGAKVSFIRYSYKLLRDPIEEENVKIADPIDIACMKIDAITSRGKKKDFVDLYFLLEHFMLSEILDLYEKKFENIQYNMVHIIKSLVYFDDAENDPDVIFLDKKTSWTKVKRRIEGEVRKIILDKYIQE